MYAVRLIASLTMIAVVTALAWLVADARAASLDAEKLSLWPDKAPIGDEKFETANVTVTLYSASKPNGAAIVICPGGGYRHLASEAEGHEIAKWLNQYGITGIVLEYRLPAGRPFVPLLDAQRTLRTVRFKAKKWNINPDRIGIIGFSAGGHLASTASTHFDNGNPNAADPIDRLSCRPDFTILIYPVITMGEKTHRDSKLRLLGRHPNSDLVELFSNEKQVTDKTPPMLLVHAKDDTLVPSDNSQMMYDALKTHKVAAEYLELPRGNHGFDGHKGPMWEAWKSKSIEWLANQKIIPAENAAAKK